MKIQTFNSFNKSQKINEEVILQKIGKFFGGLFQKAKQLINKIKGGNQVEAIYQKYLKLITDEFKKQANVELNLLATENESHISNFNQFSKIYESEADAKMAVDNLKNKKTILEQIVNKLKDSALKEMDAVLDKMGGESKNPKLAKIISAKKDQFDIAFMNAQIQFLEQSGDKTMVPQIKKQRDEITKRVESAYKEIETQK